ncbi:P-loop NTPase fold protein [Yersinia enterocolitica]|uniref:P-loop NTPase fold protein n=1 Tax=Yersinia enterocolitica TaxID=630 RepID=UPI0028B66B72|nr:hypothetical protein [Yersinia enterocolitica]
MMELKNDDSCFVKAYLEYYMSIDNPGYAVLITGEWGVGKTYQIEKTITKEKMYYVSLFGLTSTKDIYSSIYLKMFPYKGKIKKIFSLFGNSNVKVNEFTLNYGGLLENITNSILKDEVDKSKIIVFDDLERCKIKFDDVLGVINRYVEHHKCRVIVIAHDEKIKNKISNKKEKIFGQVIRVKPNIKSAFDSFVKTSKVPNAIEPIKNIIYESFLASECKSLRILQHTINDCSRLLEKLNSEQISNKTVVSELFTLFCALTISFRLGNLQESDLKNRENLYYISSHGTDSNPPPKLIQIRDVFSKNNIEIRLSSDLITDEALIDCIFNGYYDGDSIKKQIEKSQYFNYKTEIRPWYKIINFDELETQEIKEAINELFDKISKLEITETGEILHSFNLLFMLSDIGEINHSIDEVYELSYGYIKKLQYKNKIIAPEIKDYNVGLSLESAYGYGYWINDSYKNESRKLLKVINHELLVSLKKKYPLFIDEIKNALNNNIPLFCSLISNNSIDHGKYTYLDVLAYIKPYDFVDMWLKSSHKDWRKVRDALNKRYAAGGLHNQLAKESLWIKQVKINLKHRADNLSGIDKLRLSRLIPK